MEYDQTLLHVDEWLYDHLFILQTSSRSEAAAADLLRRVRGADGAEREGAAPDAAPVQREAALHCALRHT